MNRIAFAVLWIQIFILPWELFLTFQETAYLPRIGSLGRVVGLVLLPLVVLDVLDRGGKVRPLGAFHLFTIAFVWWAGMSLFWSLDPEETWVKVQTYAQLALLTWMIWELAPTQKRQRSLLAAYVLGAYVSTVDTIVQFFNGSLENSARFAATGFNPNDLGFTIVLAMPMAWYLALTQQGKLGRWLNLLYLPLGMTAVLLTASRGAFIPAVVSLLIIPLTLPGTHSWSMRGAILGLVLISVVVLQDVIPAYSWERLAATRAEIESGEFGDRSQIWKAGLQVFEQHPLAGVGAGAFGAAVEPILGDPRGAHQTFLSVLVGQGLIGLLLFLAMFVAAGAPVWRMPSLPRAFWSVLLLTLAIGLQPRTWDYRKPVWFILAVLATHAAQTEYGRSRAGALQWLSLRWRHRKETSTRPDHPWREHLLRRFDARERDARSGLPPLSGPRSTSSHRAGRGTA
jgi:O-antigen ligase